VQLAAIVMTANNERLQRQVHLRLRRSLIDCEFDMAERGSLKILHVFRAPVGGLFRHVLDLSRGQIARGHRVGIVADASTGGRNAEAKLAELAPHLALGLSRVPMSRQLGFVDAMACAHVASRAVKAEADVIHGHGAKGGAYARLARPGGTICVYTPHGGSLHYSWTSPAGVLYLALERLLTRRTDLFLFESAFGRGIFSAKIGTPASRARVVHNGVTAAEFAPITPDAGATDLVFVGELRMLKGIDVLIDAVGRLARAGLILTTTIVGDGPDQATFEAQVRKVGLARMIRFLGARPARTAFALGRLLVVPSRAESLPYIVLEAAAAGVPLVATRVGGISEIYGPEAPELVSPADGDALARALAAAWQNPAATAAVAARLQKRVRIYFSAEDMTDAVLGGYSEARSATARPGRLPMPSFQSQTPRGCRHGSSQPAGAAGND
jgi:glycosyltransferase involved in cell wall biosynthesis